MRRLLAQADRHPVLVGVVHLLATPGAPGWAGSLDELLERAVGDARALTGGGADAVLVENFGDAPFFPERVPPETVAAMASALAAVREAVGDTPVGVNVLRNDARAGLGLCAALDAAFLRVNVHVGAMVTDQGLIEGRAAETLRERARLAPDALVVADVHVKHATPLGAEDLPEAAHETCHRGRADVLVVSGRRTGDPPAVAALRAVRERVPGAPLWIGSGLTEANASALLDHADGAIVGTWLKRDGRLEEAVDEERVRRLRAALDAAAGRGGGGR